MSKNISQYLDSYENITLLGDFDMTPEDKNLQNFTDTFSLDNLINEPTCFKGNPNCIDLILTNRKCYFKNTCVTETGVSDFHKLTAVSLKSHILKSPSKVKHFRNYKSFNENTFNEDLKSRIDSTEKLQYPLFESIFNDVLNTHAPIKTKTVRANNHQFINKALRKAIMTRSRLKNIYLKTRNNENWDKYKKQRNFCTNLLRKTKNDYFRCLNIKDLNDNKKFWKKVKPFLSDKVLENNNIILKGKDELITDSSTLANLFNNYFINIKNTLKLKKSPSKFQSLSKLLTHYKDHLSIQKIKETFKIKEKFEFNEVSSEEVKKVIKSLDKKKAAISTCIPVKILIDSIDTYLPILTDIINNSIRNGTFPDELKLAEVTPIFKKADTFDITNYRLVSLLSHVSKVYERIIFNQISACFEPLFSTLLTGFRKNQNTQHSLLKMLELWKEALDQRISVSAIFMDLSKAFDTLNHDLLLAKLEAYGFSENSIGYIQSYLGNCLQRTNVNNNFSLWKDIFTGVPQGSILGPLLFNIYILIYDIFLFVDNAQLCNYADDTTLYSIQENHETNKDILNKNFLSLQNWFYDNYMVLNPGKCYFMSLGSNSDNSDLILEDSPKIPSSEEYIALGITIDNKLTFYSHLKQLCKKVANKLNALTRVAPYLDYNQGKLIYNSFFKGQPSYCPLIWKFCSRRSNCLINQLQERALRIIHKDYNSSFSELLETTNEATIYIRNLKFLVTEIYKFLNDLSPPIMSEVFQINECPYNLRNPRTLASKHKSAVIYGLDNIAFQDPQIGQDIPLEIRNSESLYLFKSNIKQMQSISCQCKICKTFIANLGYLD